jgi:ZipA, C-terminal FtsZ-binding domain
MYLLISIIIVAIGIYFFFDKEKPSELDNYFVSAQSQSDNRVKSLSLDKPSEDFFYILDTSKLVFDKNIRDESSDRVYKADTEREWVLSLNAVNSKAFTKSDLDKIFDLEWRQKFTSTIYGLSSEDNKWTYANAGDAPNSFTKLQVAISILMPFNEKTNSYDTKLLDRFPIELSKRLKKQGFDIAIEPSESVENVLVKSKKLVDFKTEFNRDAIIVLNNDKPFDGNAAWDALICTGLKWGDGDLFHWENYGSEFGHDTHFSVWTTTNPGYFLPEQIVNGLMNPSNLVFGFSIPRCADPENVFNAMINTVKYCQKRLGGIVLDKNGQPFDAEKEQKNLLLFLEKMKINGLVAGSNKALITF